MIKITMTAKIPLDSIEGIRRKYFFPQFEYEFIETEFRYVIEPTDDNPYIGRRMKHYKIVEDDCTYWMPEIYCVEIDTEKYPPKPADIQPYTDVMKLDKGEYERLKFSNELDAPDVQVLYNEMLGRRIPYHQGPEYAPWLLNLLKKR